MILLYIYIAFMIAWLFTDFLTVSKPKRDDRGKDK